eukprot:CAMPEP_0198594232 /NCGR_PEP_ID=MMETSP1462-20131121/140393_1 /TAXON_ID=1333877 /ORGANISM="Brandtodinium nutriculum, Strain RCC3387" /LENGTH=38 /DNA_ID= /DNA_START= /DNA_END= /DNA_ORIENTATION=
MAKISEPSVSVCTRRKPARRCRVKGSSTDIAKRAQLAT